jgi:hypothetical protein
MTFLAPFQPANVSPDTAVRRLNVEAGSGIACCYEHHGYKDIAIFSTGDAEIAVADFRMRGEFFWLRVEGRVLKQVAAIRACSLSHEGKNVFERSEAGSYFSQPHQFEPRAPGMVFEVEAAGSEEGSLCAQSAGL